MEKESRSGGGVQEESRIARGVEQRSSGRGTVVTPPSDGGQGSLSHADTAAADAAVAANAAACTLSYG